MGKRQNAKRANQQWYNERYDRAKENWSNYSKWTTILQRDIDSYSDTHANERGSIVARLEAQGYKKDSVVYQDAIQKLEKRQAGDISEATKDLKNLKTGATRDILMGDGSQIDATPYSEYLTDLATGAVNAQVQSEAKAYADKAVENARFRETTDMANDTITAEQQKQEYYDSKIRDYMQQQERGEGSSYGDEFATPEERINQQVRLLRGGADAGQMSLDEFYTKEYGVWEESPDSIRQKKEIASSELARGKSGGQRAYKQMTPEKGMAGGRAMGSEFDLDPTSATDEMDDLEDLSLRGF